MNNKSVQIRLPKDDIVLMVKKAIMAEIERVIKKSSVPETIKLAVDDAVVDLDLPDVAAKLVELDSRVSEVEKKCKKIKG